MVLSSAVTLTVMGLAPSSSAMAWLSVPLVTAVRLPVLPTSTEAPAWLTVGLSFTCVMALATLAEYATVAAAKAGVSACDENVPLALSLVVAVSPLSVASLEGGSVSPSGPWMITPTFWPSFQLGSEVVQLHDRPPPESEAAVALDKANVVPSSFREPWRKGLATGGLGDTTSQSRLKLAGALAK